MPRDGFSYEDGMVMQNQERFARRMNDISLCSASQEADPRPAWHPFAPHRKPPIQWERFRLKGLQCCSLPASQSDPSLLHKRLQSIPGVKGIELRCCRDAGGRSREARLACLLCGLELANQASIDFAKGTSRLPLMRLPDGVLHVVLSVVANLPLLIVNYSILNHVLCRWKVTLADTPPMTLP